MNALYNPGKHDSPDGDFSENIFLRALGAVVQRFLKSSSNFYKVSNVKFSTTLRSTCFVCCAALLPLAAGCDSQKASDAMKEVGSSAENVAGEAGGMMEKGKEMAGKAAADGEKMASELGAKAMAMLAPLKEKLGSLDSLKETPEKLKVAVTELIASIEEKAGSIELPEAMSNALETVKEKLVALKDYLGGEYEQSGINTKVDDILGSVKSGLGM